VDPVSETENQTIRIIETFLKNFQEDFNRKIQTLEDRIIGIENVLRDDTVVELEPEPILATEKNDKIDS
jgi:hypothetical protein